MQMCSDESVRASRHSSHGNRSSVFMEEPKFDHANLIPILEIWLAISLYGIAKSNSGIKAIDYAYRGN